MTTYRAATAADSAKGSGARNGRTSRIRFKVLSAAMFVPVAVSILAAPARANTIEANLSGTCSGYSFTPANAPSIPSIVNQQPSGTVFCFAPGTYRLTNNITPKAGDQLVGAGATRSDVILTGAKVISNWTLSGGLNVHTGDTVSMTKAGQCFIGTACTYPDGLFMNDTVMTRVLSPCTLTNVTVGTFCVDYAAGKMYIFDSPVGQDVEYSYVKTAIDSASGVIVKDMTITKFANTAAAVVRVGDNSTMDNMQMSGNHDCAVGIVGAVGTVVKNSRFDHNGALGYCGTSTGALFTNNEVDHNNTLGFLATFEGGGGKFWKTVNTTVTNNNIHDNNGNGIWFDGDSKGATVTGNTVSGNSGIYGAGNGITMEVSCNATINSNVSTGNYLAGIQVRNSHDVNVGAVGAGNTVSGSVKFGIRVVADKTGTQTRCGAITASNNHVVGNDISMPVGTSWTGVQRVSPAVANGDTFSDNHYHMPLATDCLTGLRWKWWDGGAMRSLKFSGTGTWQGTYRQDMAPGGSCGT